MLKNITLIIKIFYNLKINIMKKQYKKNKKAFTLVELIVVAILIIILSTIWISSFVWYVSNARDSQRKSDLLQINSSLKLYKQKRWFFPFPWDYFNINYDSNIVSYQWLLNQNVRIDSLEQIPRDPKNKVFYPYSITKNKQEFLVASTLENDNSNISLINGNYSSVSKNILPTILFATWSTIWSNLEIKSWTSSWDSNRKLFIYNSQKNNLAYTFEKPFSAYSDWTSFDELLNEVEVNNLFWQNSDFRNCIEIEEAWKLIIPLTSTPFEYQIVSETWALVNTWCTL